MADLTQDVYVAYLRGFSKARTKAVVTESDFGTLNTGGSISRFSLPDQYAAFALGITDGGSNREVAARPQLLAAVKQMLGEK